MSRPVQPPHVVRDSEGRPRLKITAGRRDGFGKGSHAQWFSLSGARTTRNGARLSARSPESFARAVWDFPDGAATSPRADALDPEAALSLLARSKLFCTNLEATQRGGWSLIIAGPQDQPGCRKGPNEVVVDPAPRAAFVANLVRQVSLARALDRPLPALDPLRDGEDFTRRNAIFLMRADAESRLDAALVRDELLGRGEADIGGPIIRGSQIAAYLQHIEGRFTRDEAIAAIARSPDGAEGATFLPGQGPRVAVDLARAFLFGGRLDAPPLSPYVIELVQRIRALSVLDVAGVSRALGVKLVEVTGNAFVGTHTSEGGTGAFTRLELRVSRAGAGVPSRLVCTPRTDVMGMSMASFRAWFGRGVPHHLELGTRPHATMAIPSSPHTVYVTYALGAQGQDERVTALTFETGSLAASTGLRSK